MLQVFSCFECFCILSEVCQPDRLHDLIYDVSAVETNEPETATTHYEDHNTNDIVSE